MHARKFLGESLCIMGMSYVMSQGILRKINKLWYPLLRVSIHSPYLKNVEALPYGKKIELRTDHSGLKYFIEQPTLNDRQT
jgi:hypothetical protein